MNNKAQSNGNEIYFDGGTVNLINTLIWNTAESNAIYTGNSATVNYDHCAYPGAANVNNINLNECITLSAWSNPVSSDVNVNGVTHKVYRIWKNYDALESIIGKGNSDLAPASDQLGNAFANPPSIGAVEIILNTSINGAETINAKHGGTAKTETFTHVVSLDDEALTTDYTIFWDAEVSPAASAISIDQVGSLTVRSATPAGTYTATVKAQATYTKITDPVIKSNIAEATVAITVESGDINLTLTSKDLPDGKIGTAYTEEQYFTATATPSSADLAWEFEGLPAGLSFSEGKISGTPKETGDFTVKVTVTATLANYNTVSKDVTASITVQSADMNLTLTKNSDLPAGKLGTAYSEQLENHFTLAGAPNGASTAWSIKGNLPDGLNLADGKISGTPTKAGTFNFSVVATVTAENYIAETKEIAASITVSETGNQQDPEEEQEEEQNSSLGDTITSPENGIESYTPEQKAAAKTLILTSVEDLSKISAEDFKQLTKIEISSDASISSENLVLTSLPSTVKEFVITNNKNVKSLIITSEGNSLENVDAKGCEALESVDISGNSTIVSLDLKGSTSLTALNASSCENLKFLDCSECKLFVFDIEKCPNLVSLDCSYNSLLKLDMTEFANSNLKLNCISQDLGNWRPTLRINFEQFMESPDLSPDVTVSVADVNGSAFSNVSNLKAYDVNGELIKITSDDVGNVIFASLPYIMTYDYDTGYNEQKMDVTVYAADDLTNSLGGSGGCGGCNLLSEGLSFRNVLILLMLELALLKLKIKRS